MRHLPDGAQIDGDGGASSSIDIGGCTVSGQRCWKLDTRGHSTKMAAARPQHMKRIFIRSRISPPWLILCIRVAEWHKLKLATIPTRRFPPPWTVEEQDACFVVRGHNGQALAYVYFEEESGRRSAALVAWSNQRA
jgi:hypothetical protein